MVQRILYVQYADPAAYPPIDHSTEILAERGWEIVLLGTNAFGNHGLRLSSNPRIRVENLPRVMNARGQQLQYVRFFLRCLFWTWRWRPKWIYASDPLVLPALWLLSNFTRTPILYHEHDSPNCADIKSIFMRLVWECRLRVGRFAEVCVLPQRERLADFVRTTGRTGRTILVWNCPRQKEVRKVASIKSDSQLTVYYHGSINPARVPPELIVAASRFRGAVRIQIAGYEAAGDVGYVDRLKVLANEHGVPGMVESLGTIPLRNDLLTHASKADVALSFMPEGSSDINLRHMVGASNKPFDCMAQGVPLLVSNLADWVSTFVENGFGRACDPRNADSIESALRWYIEHPCERANMARRCAEKIVHDWNYETQFGAVLSVLEKE